MVEIEHCHLGKWHTKRPSGAVAIPIIVFKEGGMQIPMGKVTRYFLIFYRLCLTQCSPNVFKILGSIDILSHKMGVKLTHHDINWVYNY